MKIIYATFHKQKNTKDWRYFGLNEYHTINENEKPDEILAKMNHDGRGICYDWKYVLLDVEQNR